MLVVIAVIGALVLRYVITNPRTVRSILTADFSAELKKLTDGVSHSVDVSAVVEMVRQLDTDPDALEKIESYPETVRAAAWLHYIDQLGDDLRKAQMHLSKSHSSYRSCEAPVVKSAQEHVNALRAKLDTAVAASGQSGLRAV